MNLFVTGVRTSNVYTPTRIEPAGAGGATGASLQLRRHQLGRGGRWRRSRHLRRVQRPRQGGIENGPSRRRVPGGTPFFECSFHEITIEFLLELVQKAACKKLNRITDKQTDRQNPADIELGRGHVLDSSHADTIRKCLQNLSPKRPSDSC